MSFISKPVDTSGFISSDALKFQRGTFDSDGIQLLDTLSTATINIALDASDYEFGTVLIYRTDSSTSKTRRTHSTIYITTALNDAKNKAEIIDRINVAGSSYTTDDWRTKVWDYSIDGQLSDGEAGVDVTGSAIFIQSCRINGSNIELGLENASGAARNYEFKGEFRVWKTP